MAEPKFEHDAAFQILHGAGEDQEIAVAGSAQRRAVAVGMLVDNVVADARVNGGRNRQPVGRCEDAGVLVWEIALPKCAARRFPRGPVNCSAAS